MITCDDQHVYRVDGEIRPGVNEILKSAELTPDFSRVEPQVLQNKAAAGSYVHEQCARILRGGVVDGAGGGYVSAFWKFLQETGFVAEGIEQPLYSSRYKFCGTPDFWGVTRNNQRVIADIKTPLAFGKSWRLQLAAYWLLLDDDLPITKVTLRLRPDGTYRITDATDPFAKNVFLAALREFYGDKTKDSAEWIKTWKERN